MAAARVQIGLASRCVASTLSQPIGPSEAQIYLLAVHQRSSTGGRAHRSRRHSLGPPSPIAASRRARSFHLDSSSLDVATQPRNQQMEQVQMAISTESRPVGDVRYVMTVRHLSAHAVWRMYRSFDEYHGFQGRLLRALHHGHVCSASLASAKLLPHRWDSTKRLVAHRQETLAHVLQTVQTFRCTRQNQASSVMSEFLDFVYGQVVDDKRVLLALWHETQQRSPRDREAQVHVDSPSSASKNARAAALKWLL
ncbi:hypothetical protein PHYSODRAFT_257979 [Phytophthora sojae]|uniref:PX domain-containing protein n=1 Tax=Phytophthora sojae (strain P6497) TaxID=1094619 RepID=G4YZY6_PHYSP|nr:hypothetical protein PHYSODRAFT_257979 [Phytophthora sojae]EGZ23349.1 hypothetical protein PHYSODRAFT_257979 [Phytophthora sojae]|eukprot:XP_009518637.1 hypothetical protein PHYSODRAFT_257979 [Phytophthora sojae]